MFPSASRTTFSRTAAAASRGAVAMQLRAALLAGCAAALGLAAWAGNPADYLQADPALARLLRGMALLKGLIAIAAVGAVFWRFGWRVSKPAAASYLVASWVLAAATMMIWQLSCILPAALLFHAAAISLLWVGWRER